MNHVNRPYVQLAINEVDLVLSDPEERYDSDQFDRYETFEAARDAALTSLEVILDEGDYDDEDHRREIEMMLEMIEASSTFEELALRPEYRQFLQIASPVLSAA